MNFRRLAKCLPHARVTLQQCRHNPLVRVAKKPLRLDDEVQFIRSWIEKPLSTGAVMPSSKALARTMARYVDPQLERPGDRTGSRHRTGDRGAGEHGVDPARLILVEFNPRFLPPAAHALSGGDRRAGRRLSAAPPAGDLREGAGRSHRVRPAAGHQACARAAAPDLGCHGVARAGRARSCNSPTPWSRRFRRRSPASPRRPPS